jgi:hypothetical protein
MIEMKLVTMIRILKGKSYHYHESSLSKATASSIAMTLRKENKTSVRIFKVKTGKYDRSRGHYYRYDIYVQGKKPQLKSRHLRG